MTTLTVYGYRLLSVLRATNDRERGFEIDTVCTALTGPHNDPSLYDAALALYGDIITRRTREAEIGQAFAVCSNDMEGFRSWLYNDDKGRQFRVKVFHYAAGPSGVLYNRIAKKVVLDSWIGACVHNQGALKISEQDIACVELLYPTKQPWFIPVLRLFMEAMENCSCIPSPRNEAIREGKPEPKEDFRLGLADQKHYQDLHEQCYQEALTKGDTAEANRIKQPHRLLDDSNIPLLAALATCAGKTLDDFSKIADGLSFEPGKQLSEAAYRKIHVPIQQANHPDQNPGSHIDLAKFNGIREAFECKAPRWPYLLPKEIERRAFCASYPRILFEVDGKLFNEQHGVNLRHGEHKWACKRDVSAERITRAMRRLPLYQTFHQALAKAFSERQPKIQNQSDCLPHEIFSAYRTVKARRFQPDDMDKGEWPTPAQVLHAYNLPTDDNRTDALIKQVVGAWLARTNRPIEEASAPKLTLLLEEHLEALRRYRPPPQNPFASNDGVETSPPPADPLPDWFAFDTFCQPAARLIRNWIILCFTPTPKALPVWCERLLAQLPLSETIHPNQAPFDEVDRVAYSPWLMARFTQGDDGSLQTLTTIPLEKTLYAHMFALLEATEGRPSYEKLRDQLDSYYQQDRDNWQQNLTPEQRWSMLAYAALCSTTLYARVFDRLPSHWQDTAEALGAIRLSQAWFATITDIAPQTLPIANLLDWLKNTVDHALAPHLPRRKEKLPIFRPSLDEIMAWDGDDQRQTLGHGGPHLLLRANNNREVAKQLAALAGHPNATKLSDDEYLSFSLLKAWFEAVMTRAYPTGYPKHWLSTTPEALRQQAELREAFEQHLTTHQDWWQALPQQAVDYPLAIEAEQRNLCQYYITDKSSYYRLSFDALAPMRNSLKDALEDGAPFEDIHLTKLPSPTLLYRVFGGNADITTKTSSVGAPPIGEGNETGFGAVTQTSYEAEAIALLYNKIYQWFYDQIKYTIPIANPLAASEVDEEEAKTNSDVRETRLALLLRLQMDDKDLHHILEATCDDIAKQQGRRFSFQQKQTLTFKLQRAVLDHCRDDAPTRPDDPTLVPASRLGYLAMASCCELEKLLDIREQTIEPNEGEKNAQRFPPQSLLLCITLMPSIALSKVLPPLIAMSTLACGVSFLMANHWLMGGLLMTAAAITFITWHGLRLRTYINLDCLSRPHPFGESTGLLSGHHSASPTRPTWRRWCDCLAGFGWFDQRDGNASPSDQSRSANNGCSPA